MRHILIILISILLLSSPVIGDNHKGETLYLWETSSGSLWKGFGDKETHSVYKGDVKNGKPNGVGICMYYNGDKYVGEWKDGEWNGKGTYSYWYGGKYVGDWKDGFENGEGTYDYTDGRMDEGEYKYSQEYNRGLLWNGTQYDKDGKIRQKIVNGKWIDQSKKEEVLYRGKRNGEIGWYEEKWEGVVSKDNRDNGKYEGEIKNGIPNGQGTETWSDGSKYVGEFKDGKWDGQGTITWSNGQKYVGEFNDGLPNGQGTFTQPDGVKYVGEWKDGGKNGQGTITWSNGQKYVGEFKDGKEHGQGILTFPDGRKYDGEWKDGTPWNGTLFVKNGNIVRKWVNGKGIEQ